MKIALFTDTYFPQVNGVVRVVDLSARALAALGHEVVVVAPDAEVVEDLKKRSLNYSVISVPSVAFPFYPDVRLSRPTDAVFESVRAFGPEVIHVHTPFQIGAFAVRSARSLGIPLIGTHHTFFDHYLKYVWLDFAWARSLSWNLINRYYDQCDALVIPTQSLVNAMQEHGLQAPCVVVVNPVDTEAFEPFATDADRLVAKHGAGFSGPTMVYMGRIAYEKDTTDLVDVLAIARRRCPELKLVFVGDGPFRSELEAYIAKRGMNDAVIFSGFLHKEELSSAVRIHDVFVTAAKSENMPVSVLEAMAAGVPVCAVSVLGIPELVHEGENGYLARPGDRETFAENVVTIATDAQVRERLSRAARAMTLKHKPATIAALLEAIYREHIHAKA